jgi:hypothetical protein
MQSDIEKKEMKENKLGWTDYWNLVKEKTRYQRSLPVEKLLEEVGYYAD